MKKTLILSSFVFGCFLSTPSFAAIFNIESMNITSGTITRNFLPTPDTINLNLGSNTNLVGGYINNTTGGAISVTNFGMPGNPVMPPQFVYTAVSNINHNGNGTAPINGTHLGGSVPSGIVDDVLNTITMDLSSWFANHMIMDQNLGSENAAGTWDTLTGAYHLSWDATLTQGGAAGGTVTWNLEGIVLDASPVPVPAAVWLMGTALLGLQRFRRTRTLMLV